MKLETYEHGKGEPILFLGGAFTTFNYYQKFLNLLSKYFKVYFFNYPGFGKSEKFTNGHSIENYEKTIEHFVKIKNLKKFHLAGASFGGLLAIHHAHRHSEQVNSLILFSPLTKSSSDSKLYSAYNLIKENLGEKIKFRDRILILNAFDRTNFRNLREKLKHGIFVHTCSLDKHSIPTNIPILLIIGEKDKIVDINYTKKLFSETPNTKIISYREFGHEAGMIKGSNLLQTIKEFTSATTI